MIASRTDWQPPATTQAGVWDLATKPPQVQSLCRENVVNVVADWPVIFSVEQQAYVELQELLAYNGTAGTVVVMLALLRPDDPLPNTTSFNQEFVTLSFEVPPGRHLRHELSTGLDPLDRVAAYTSGGVGDFVRLTLSGTIVGAVA